MPALNIIKPPVDIIEERDSYTVVVDLPGVEPEDVQVVGYDDYIEITGIKRPVSGGNYLLMERFSGKFKRKIHFRQNVDIASAVAQLKNGVLIIKIPKSKDRIMFTSTTIIIRR
ncbi:Hsp20/alpha crystallin family protein [Persephonella sp.]|nr:Hsp20/alpha crystallin family protein [Aquificota bacterium]